MPSTITGTKISALTAASSASDSDVLAGVQANATKKFSFAVIKAWIKSWLAPSDIGAQEAVGVGTISLPLSWSGSDPYTQTVTVTGATITSSSLISLQPTAAQLTQLLADGVTALTIENNAGTLTAYALGAAPTTAMTIACTVTEVAS